MAFRRVVIDSDDDVDENFLSARPPATRKLPKSPEKPSAAPAKSLDLASPRSTNVRRRKLGAIDNDQSLLQPWTANDKNKAPKGKTRILDSSDENGDYKPRLPSVRRLRPRIELSTRRTRRKPQLVSDDSDDISAEEATVLEDVTLEGDKEGRPDESKDTRKTGQTMKHDAKRHDMGQGIRNDGDKKDKADSEDDDHGVDNESSNDDTADNASSDDNESDAASEFHDSSSSDNDLSDDSLDVFFHPPREARRPPQRRQQASPPRPSRPPSRPSRARPGKIEQRPASLSPPGESTGEASSVFFSAEESFAELLTGPMDRLNLDDPSVQDRSPPPKSKSARPKASTARPITPPRPRQPPTLPPPGNLMSPTKKLPRIPKTPHRPSMDAFWDQQVVDDWNSEHSPRKLLFDDEKAKKIRQDLKNTAASEVTLPDKNSKKSNSRTAAKALETKKAFQKAKKDIAEAFLAELDAAVTDGQLARLAAATGGVRIEWTNKLNTTAGRAKWRRETRHAKKSTVAANSASFGSILPPPPPQVLHYASIELADKVVDDEHRLLNVLAHEFCHLACFMVSGLTTNPHGREFKAWAAQCKRHFGQRGIQVTTKHTYEIDFKYVWVCADCAAEYKRHSRSIDPVRHRCGACKGQLQQTKPVPRGSGGGSRQGPGGGGASGSTARPGVRAGMPPAPTEYQKFMKEHMGVLRQENPNSPQKDIMKLLAGKWKQAKQARGATGEEFAGQGRSDRNNGGGDAGHLWADLTLE